MTPTDAQMLHHIIYDVVQADVETEAEAENDYQSGYAEGFNDARCRILNALTAAAQVKGAQRETVTDEMIKAGSEAIDKYYDGTKDAPFEGSVEACYRAMRLTAPAAEVGQNNYNTENYSYKAYERAIEIAAIERCAKFAEDYFEMEYEKGYGEMIADAMREALLKDKS